MTDFEIVTSVFTKHRGSPLGHANPLGGGETRTARMGSIWGRIRAIRYVAVSLGVLVTCLCPKRGALTAGGADDERVVKVS